VLSHQSKGNAPVIFSLYEANVVGTNVALLFDAQQCSARVAMFIM